MTKLSKARIAAAPDKPPVSSMSIPGKPPVSSMSLNELQAARAREVKKILGKLARHLARPPRVAVAGEFNAGKSTVVNALLGQVVVSHSILTRSSLPVLLHYSETPVLHVEFEGGRRIDVTEGVGKNFSMRGVQLLSAGLPIERLKEYEIIDTPGFGSGRPDVDRRAFTACRFSHVVVWCTSAMQAWKRTESTLWRSLPERIRENGILAVTYKDALQVERDAVRLSARMKAETAGQFRTFVLVAAAEAMAASQAANTAEVEADDENHPWVLSGGENLAAAVHAAVAGVLARRLGQVEELLKDILHDMGGLKGLLQRH